MSYSNYQLNQRINYLQSEINNLPSPTPPQNLAGVLQEGNNAGSYSIDMNIQDINNVNNLNVNTINGSTYPVPQITPSLSDVMTVGNSSGTNDLNMNHNDITTVNNLTVNNVDLTTINGSSYPPVVSTPSLSDVMTVGNSSGTNNLNMNHNDITTVNNLTVNNLISVNDGTLIPPYTVNIEQDGITMNDQANSLNLVLEPSTINLNNSLGASNISNVENNLITDSSNNNSSTTATSLTLNSVGKISEL